MKRLWMLLLFSAVSAADCGASPSPKANARIQWPWVYPAVWKISPGLQWHSLCPSDSGLPAALVPGVQAELLFNKNFLAGISFDYFLVAPGDPVSEGRILKYGLTIGFMIPLDDLDIHHIVLQLNPALAMGSFRTASKTSFGFSLGAQYEFTLFSNHILAPGIFYSRFPSSTLQTPSPGTWSLGMRYIIGK